VQIWNDATSKISANFNGNGAATLYNNGSSKLATTATGIDVTGTVTADGTASSSVPKYTFAGDVNTGLAYIGADAVGLLAAGSRKFYVNATTGYFQNLSGGVNFGSAIDVTGTVTADGLDVEIADNLASPVSIQQGGNGYFKIVTTNGSESVQLGNSTTNPDILMGGGSVGIGTSTAGTLHGVSYGTTKLHIDGGTDRGQIIVEGDSLASIVMSDNGATANSRVFITQVNDGLMTFKSTNDSGTSKATIMTMTSSGNVGIGTSSPVTLKSATTLQVSGNAKLGDDNGRGLLSLGDIASTGANAGIWRGAAGAYAGTGNYLNLGGYDGITFTTGNADISSQTERLRIDSSGNLLVGQTTASSNTVGTSLRSDGRNFYCADGNYSGHFNRKTSDGAIVHFAKDDTVVGSIGTYVNLPYIGKNDVNLLFDPTGPHIIPRGTAGGARDAAINLGSSTNRFKDLYLSGGVYLGGTGAANKLDDYEEGTWTPVFKRAGSTNNATIAFQGANYVKSGKQVTVTVYVTSIDYSAVTDGTFAVIEGLPFTSDGWHSGSIGYGGATNVSETTWVLNSVTGSFLSALGNGFYNGNPDLNRGMFTATYITA
jgi:hypothetical protein